MKHTLSKIIENIEKWGTPLGERDSEEETSVENAVPVSPKVMSKAVFGGVKVEQEQSLPELKEEKKEKLSDNEDQKLIRFLGEQRKV